MVTQNLLQFTVYNFSDKECNEIERPVLLEISSKTGHNRNTHKNIVHGPCKYGGLGYSLMTTLKGTKHLQLLDSLKITKDRTWTLMVISLRHLQLEAVISTLPLYESTSPHISNTHLDN